MQLITECFFNFQKFQIQMCAYRHPIFQDYIIESTAERHFKHFWNVIVKIVQGHDSFGENLSIYRLRDGFKLIHFLYISRKPSFPLSSTKE